MNKQPLNSDFSTIGHMKAVERQKREDDQLLSQIATEVQGVLGEIQYISELLEMNKNVAPVEDLAQKIKASYQKIKNLLEAGSSLEAGLGENNRNTGGLNLEKNPLVEEMGGMPLETISAEWREIIEGAILDKAELENLVNKKLKDRVELANKLKLKNKLTNQPKLKIGQPLTPKFKKIQQALKYIIKEIPPAPAPKYVPSVPPPRPHGM